MTHSNIIKAGCLQLCSGENVDENLRQINTILKKNTTKGLKVLLLPENATLLTSNDQYKHLAAQKTSYLKIFDFFSQLAMQYQTWIVAGSLLIQDKHHANQYFNHCPIFSPHGKMCASYNKIHLFDVNLGTESWQESASISAGDKPTAVRLSDHWQVGLSICYDLRFPELYRNYSQQGCNILTVPAAFTVPTGKAHWGTLLRARAIENQCYVLAAGQSGTHQDGRSTYGHSQIIDPWGDVLTEMEDGVGLITADLSLKKLMDIRTRLPSLQHRRF